MKEATKRRRVSAAAVENGEVTSQIPRRTDEKDTVPVPRADGVEIKRELPEESNEKIPQVQGPYRIIEPGNRQLAALDSGFLTDVTIIVGDEEIKCHSQVVSFASPKLAAIVKEKEPRLPDVDPDHFRLLLQIIYGGESCQQPSDVTSLLGVGHLAHELEVYTALVLCANWLASKVDAEHLWGIIDFANLISAPQLEDICMKMISSFRLLLSLVETYCVRHAPDIKDKACHTPSFEEGQQKSETTYVSSLQVIRDRAGYILESDGFLNCKITTLEKILDQRTLYNVTELQLFEACVAWSKAKSDEVGSRRALLGSVLKLIRFRTFTAEDFAKYVCPTGLLSLEMERNIMRSSLTGENFMPGGFSLCKNLRDPSEIREIKLRAVEEKEALNASPKDTGNKYFVISVNRDVFIHGVKLRAWRTNMPEESLYEENVVVALGNRSGSGKYKLGTTKFRRQVKNGDMVSVKFKHPLELNPSVDYILQVFSSQLRGNNLTLYHSEPIICDSGLHINVQNVILAPPGLHLLVAEKTAT